jgi:hypothetical protein
VQDDNAATPPFAVPAVDMMRRKDPKDIGPKRKLLARIQKNAAPPLDHGVEFPIQP